jgi:hypothetical protein
MYIKDVERRNSVQTKQDSASQAKWTVLVTSAVRLNNRISSFFTFRVYVCMCALIYIKITGPIEASNFTSVV